jgi:hypothetical protein
MVTGNITVSAIKLRGMSKKARIPSGVIHTTQDADENSKSISAETPQ